MGTCTSLTKCFGPILERFAVLVRRKFYGGVSSTLSGLVLEFRFHLSQETLNFPLVTRMQVKFKPRPRGFRSLSHVPFPISSAKGYHAPTICPDSTVVQDFGCRWSSSCNTSQYSLSVIHGVLRRPGGGAFHVLGFGPKRLQSSEDALHIKII